MTNTRGRLLSEIAAEHGTPCYVYFLDDVLARVALLKRAFGGRFRVSYAVKANPNPELLRSLHDAADTLDISSGGELQKALNAGWVPQRLSFTGPAKRYAEIEAAVRARIGEIVIEGVAEAEDVNELAGLEGIRQRVLVRIAPSRMPRGFGVNMAGKPSQFGIDEEDIDAALERIRALPNIEVAGLHIFSGTQCLDANSIVENYGIYVDLFRRVAEQHDLRPEKLIFGSSLGIPYHAGDQPVDIEAVAGRTNDLLDELRRDARFEKTVFYLETGRFLVGEAGVFLTSVIRRKSSRGVEVGICDGGMNHHLGACGHLGSVLHRNYPISRLRDIEADEAQEKFDLVGPLCTSIDRLGHNVKLNGLEVGDVIAIESSGAYGLSASPVYFISHPVAREIMVATEAGVTRVFDVSQHAAQAQPVAAQ